MLSILPALAHVMIVSNTALAGPSAELERLASLMQGSFSSEAQSKEDPEFFDIRLKMCRVWNEIPGEGIWLYVEQAASNTPDKPYRQRLYHLSQMNYPSGDGQIAHAFVSEVWLLPGDPLAFAGGCDDPSKFAAIKPADLARKDGCAVVLLAKGADVYEGGTIGRECPSDRQGASYTTSTVRIDAEGLTTWDRGFDVSGKQVWGSTKGAYRFVRVSAPPEEKK